MTRTFIAFMLGSLLTALAQTPEPKRPSPSAIRHTIFELSPAEQERVLHPGTNDVEALVMLGDHEFLQCGGDQVGAYYTAALKLQPDHIRANLGLGEWHVAYRRLEKAVPYLERAVAHAKKDSPEWSHGQAVLEYVKFKLKSEEKPKQ